MVGIAASPAMLRAYPRIAKKGGRHILLRRLCKMSQTQRFSDRPLLRKGFPGLRLSYRDLASGQQSQFHKADLGSAFDNELLIQGFGLLVIDQD